MNALGIFRVDAIEKKVGLDIAHHKGSAYDLTDITTTQHTDSCFGTLTSAKEVRARLQALALGQMNDLFSRPYCKKLKARMKIKLLRSSAMHDSQKGSTTFISTSVTQMLAPQRPTHTDVNADESWLQQLQYFIAQAQHKLRKKQDIKPLLLDRMNLLLTWSHCNLRAWKIKYKR
eukprot:scaffold1313_cov120-Skeletonema_dohrnii-CCMP3373.AAC.4